MKHEFYDFLTENGIMIGSRVWGGAREASPNPMDLHMESDYDFVLPMSKREEMLDLAAFHKIFMTEKPGSSDNNRHTMFNIVNEKGWVGDRLVNILTYEDEDIPKIEELNRIMEFLKTQPVGTSMAEDKKNRIYVVENLLEILFWEQSEESFNPDDDISF